MHYLIQNIKYQNPIIVCVEYVNMYTYINIYMCQYIYDTHIGIAMAIAADIALLRSSQRPSQCLPNWHRPATNAKQT